MRLISHMHSKQSIINLWASCANEYEKCKHKLNLRYKLRLLKWLYLEERSKPWLLSWKTVLCTIATTLYIFTQLRINKHTLKGPAISDIPSIRGGLDEGGKRNSRSRDAQIPEFWLFAVEKYQILVILSTL